MQLQLMNNNHGNISQGLDWWEHELLLDGDGKGSWDKDGWTEDSGIWQGAMGTRLKTVGAGKHHEPSPSDAHSDNAVVLSEQEDYGVHLYQTSLDNGVSLSGLTKCHLAKISPNWDFPIDDLDSFVPMDSATEEPGADPDSGRPSLGLVNWDWRRNCDSETLPQDLDFTQWNVNNALEAEPQSRPTQYMTMDNSLWKPQGPYTAIGLPIAADHDDLR